MYEKLYNLNTPKFRLPIKKCVNEMNKLHTKEEIQVANRYFFLCSASIAIREIQITTTLKLHLMPVRIDVTKENSNKYWQVGGERRSV